jgi:hypothetical protein
MRPKHWSAQEIETLRDRYTRGDKLLAISTDMGRTNSSVHRMIVRLNLRSPRRDGEDRWQQQARLGSQRLLEAIQRAAA